MVKVLKHVTCIGLSILFLGMFSIVTPLHSTHDTCESIEHTHADHHSHEEGTSPYSDNSSETSCSICMLASLSIEPVTPLIWNVPNTPLEEVFVATEGSYASTYTLYNRARAPPSLV